MNKANVACLALIPASLLWLAQALDIILPLFEMNYSNTIVFEIHLASWINNMPRALARCSEVTCFNIKHFLVQHFFSLLGCKTNKAAVGSP